MMDLFSGLAQIGAGVSRGELAGTAAEAKLQQQKSLMDFRQSQLDAQKQKGVTGDAFKLASLDARAKAPYLRALADVNNFDYFQRNPGVKVQWELRAGLHGVDPAVLPQDPNYDPATNTLRGPGGHTYTADAAPGPAGTPETGENLGAGIAQGLPNVQAARDYAKANHLSPFAPAASPQNYDQSGGYTGPNTSPSPFDRAAPPQQPDISEIGLAGPRMVNTPFGPAPSTQLLPTPAIPPVFSGEPKGGLPPYAPVQGPPVPEAPVAPQEAAPAAPSARALPVSPKVQGLAELIAAGPRAGETDKNFNDRMAKMIGAQQVSVQELKLALEAPGIVAGGQAKVAEAPYAGPTAAARLAEIAVRIPNIEQQTRESVVRTAATAALTPARLASIASEIKKRAADEDRANRQLQETTRHNQEAERTGRVNSALRAREVEAKANLDRIRGDNISWTNAHREELEQGKNTRAAMGMIGRQIGGGESIPGLGKMSTPGTALPPELINRYQGWLGANTGGTAAPPTGGTATAPAAAAAPVAQPAITSGEKRLVAGLVKSGGVHGAISGASPEQAARLRYLYSKLYPRKPAL